VYLGGYSFFFMQMPRVLNLYQGDVQEQNLFRPIDRLIDDFQSGDLPQVVFIEPLYQDDYRRGSAAASDDHPPASLYGGQRLLKIVYDALSTGAAWNNLVAFIAYDEHGSFFDHVRPPAISTAPPSQAQYSNGFNTLGLRVPGIVVSPFVRPASLCEEILDHTSILKFLGEKFNGGRYTDLVDNRAVQSASSTLDDQLLATGSTTPAPSMD
jgi:phospholipase C